ncbi:uncharacterized protein LOC123506638 [Portunus trituberculatus]|uniref:uncharacterized protein LOC123506638 n=1 Tax=Portunus trituberculatus TaxID=210409 RepID=UPI001E1D0E88|nr:uncharacterized protein LOC123506638 [Portunus trituberculatus]
MRRAALVALILLQCHQGSSECQPTTGTLPPPGPGSGGCWGGLWGRFVDKINLNVHDGVCVRVGVLAVHTWGEGVVEGETHTQDVKVERETLATHTKQVKAWKDKVKQQEAFKTTLATHTQQGKPVNDDTEQEKTHETQTQQLKTVKDKIEQQVTFQATLATHTQQLKAERDDTEQQTPQNTHIQYFNTTPHTTHTQRHNTTQTHTTPPQPHTHDPTTPPPPHTHQTHPHPRQTPQTPHTSTLPSTSTYCHTISASTLQCHFENLYYTPKYQEFAFVSGKDSRLEGVERVEELPNHLHLSTVIGHNGFPFHIAVVPPRAIQGEVWNLEGQSLVMARFKPDNLFHVLHDDVMPVYFTVLQLCGVLVSPCPPFTLLAVDTHPESPYNTLYTALGHQILLSKDLQDIEWVRLSRAIVGLSRHSVWYQYGFRQPQGPVGTRLTGLELREFAVFMLSRLGVGVNAASDGVSGVDGVGSGGGGDVNISPVDLSGSNIEGSVEINKNTLEKAESTLQTNENTLIIQEKEKIILETRENTLENQEKAENTKNCLEKDLIPQGNALENTDRTSKTCKNVVSPENTPKNIIEPTHNLKSVNLPKNTLESIQNSAKYLKITQKNTLDSANLPRTTLDLLTHPENTLKSSLDTLNHPRTPQPPALAVLLTRQLTRKILNEKELAETIRSEILDKYGEGEVKMMSLEEHGLNEVVRVISQARVLVGMHGAGLGLGIFLPQNSLLVELWPFAVNPVSARVYRVMCELESFGVVYRAWVNQDATHTRTHPHYPPHLGGVDHLPPEERREVVSLLYTNELTSVVCCMDVNWLFRIYQDTTVRLYAHTDAHHPHTHTHAHGNMHSNVNEPHMHTNGNTHTGIHEGNAHRNTHTNAHEPHTHTHAHTDTLTSIHDNTHTNTHTNIHGAVLKSVPFSVVLREGLASLPSTPQPPPPPSPLESPPQILQSPKTPPPLSQTHQSSPPPPSLLKSPPHTLQSPKTPPPPPLPLPKPGKVNILKCSLEKHNTRTKVELSWQTPWLVKALGCEGLVYEVVVAAVGGDEARRVMVMRESVVLVFGEVFGGVDVWVTCFCGGVEGVVVFVRCLLG